MALSWQLLVVRDFDSSCGKVARAVQRKKTKNVTGIWAGNASLFGHLVHLGFNSRWCRVGHSDKRLTGEQSNLNFWDQINIVAYDFRENYLMPVWDLLLVL